MMRTFLSAILTYVSAFVISRHHLALEAVVLRQQLAVYKRKQPHPKLRRSDRLFWVVFRLMWNSWSEALILVKPDTVVAWHRAGYPCSGDGARAESGGRRRRKKSDT